MKLLKSLTLGLVAAAMAGTASAQTVIHVAGSTAYRSPNTAAIIDYLGANLAPGETHVYAGYSGSTSATGLLGAGAAVIANGTIGSGGTATIVFVTFWTGSLAGVVDLVAGNNTGAYIDINNSTTDTAVNGSTVSTSPYTGGVGLGTPATITAVPEVTFSDSFKGTIQKELATGSFASGTTSIGSFSSIASLATACGGSTVVDSGTSGNAADAGFIGIVPFEWVAGNVTGGTAAANITVQAAKGLISNGFIPQSYLTGTANAADTANYFYLVGRNEDSGTRIGAFSEAQFGVTATPVQFQVNGTTSVTSAQIFPITTLNTENIVWNTAGHSGYASGSNVKAALDVPENSTALASFSGKSSENSGSTFFLGYLGITDANGAVTGGGHALSYNGVPFSVAAVQNGQYTFWTYEHAYHLSSLTGTALTAVNKVADNVYNKDADIDANGAHQPTSGTSAGILDNTSSPVLVFRAVNEGGILSNY
jgi:hypothetical protein